jgi:hypothetical protein
MSYLGTSDNSIFFNATTNATNNGTALNSLGFVAPVEVRRGAASFAFGFTRQSNFTSEVSFNGFNPLSSIIQTYAADKQVFNNNTGEQDNLAYQLYLANIDSVSPTTSRWTSPIKNNVQQSGTVTESGGLNNWMVGGAMDVAKNISVGLTLTYVAGSYRYDRTYVEQDSKLLYAYPFDFSRFQLDDYIDGEISGFNAKFGVMFHGDRYFKLGLTAKTPTWYTVSESYGTKGQSTFRIADKNGVNQYGPVSSNGDTKYDVTTPWVLGASGAFDYAGLTVSGDVEYTDWTQTKFSNADQGTLDLNASFKNTFRGTLNYRAGAEYEIAPLGLALRGGFIYNPSIYKNDPSNFDQKYFTAGLGVKVGDQTGLDLGYAHGWRDSYRVNYDATSTVAEKAKTETFVLTVTHHF